MWVVTIDGPAGAGKSTVSRLLADRLNWRLLDTGAMYRAITVAALRSRVKLENESELEALALNVSVTMPPGKVLLDGEDITSEIRTPEVTRAIRYVADSRGVRDRLVAFQRKFGAEYDVIAEGRDQGTIVFPEALRKFFLTASPQERARRRHAEHVKRGETINYETVLKDIVERDKTDESRAIAPLKPALDAMIIDTSNLTFGEVVDVLEHEVRQSLMRETIAPSHPGVLS